MLGRFREALTTLSTADGGALALFYQGRCQIQLEDFDAAVRAYSSAQKAGYDADACKLAIAEAKRLSGDAPGALAILDDMFGPIEQTAEYLFQRGSTVSKIGGNLPEAVRLYERAIQSDPRHTGALFGLALENDRAGNDDEALRLYERAASVFPTGLGVLLNLGLMYDDRNMYERAQSCYKRILDCYPDHERARLYLKDASASGNVLYDEEASVAMIAWPSCSTFLLPTFNCPFAAATACRKWAYKPLATWHARPKRNCLPVRTLAKPACMKFAKCFTAADCNSDSSRMKSDLRNQRWISATCLPTSRR